MPMLVAPRDAVKIQYLRQYVANGSFHCLRQVHQENKRTRSICETQDGNLISVSQIGGSDLHGSDEQTFIREIHHAMAFTLGCLDVPVRGRGNVGMASKEALFRMFLIPAVIGGCQQPKLLAFVVCGKLNV